MDAQLCPALIIDDYFLNDNTWNHFVLLEPYSYAVLLMLN